MRRSPRTPLGTTLGLEDRLTPATTATFLTDVLFVTGDATANAIVVSADAAGNLVVTDGDAAVPIRVVSGTPTKGNARLIQVEGKAGNDSIVLDRSLNTLDANGKLASAPSANLRGNGGHDTLTPKIGGFLGGVIGAAIVGNVVQNGGSGSDTLTSGFGNDIMSGGDGNDTLIWLPGTLLDVYEGGGGTDNAVIVGNDNDQGDAFVLSPHPTAPGRVLFQRTNLIPFFVDIDDCEVVTLRTQSGADTVTLNSLVGTDVRNVVVDAGLGDDTVDGTALASGVKLFALGGDGNDVLRGGAGNDILDGGGGNDSLFGNGGKDLLTGMSGNDSLDGGAGGDALLGGDGNDNLTGGAGADALSGGAGADVFARVGGDSLLDFTPGDGDTTV
jgi:Ca2+-binding RTX toxin-like protein